ncbi:MAG: DEAD/DEAH box helicase [Oscillospiraceae bacterium]|nr:DEAD/DEAH box helicase [Oscillospiraceae bacterium]
MSYSEEELAAYVNSNECLEGGYSLYNDGRVTITDDSMTESGNHNVLGLISSDKKYFTKITLKNHDCEIAFSCCTCPEYNCWGMCSHIAALLYKNMSEHSRKLKMVTDSAAARLMNSCADRFIISEEGNTQPAHIEVNAEMNCSTLSLEFKIGTDNMYVIKNLDAFTMMMMRCETYRYGSKFTFTHRLDNFDERSQPLVNFIMMYNGRTQTNMYYASSRRSIDLTRTNLSIFFDNYRYDTININKQSYKVAAYNPVFSVEISMTENGSYCVSLDEWYRDYAVYNSLKGSYYIGEQTVYCADRDFCEKAAQFINALFESQTYSMNIAAQEMQTFYLSVISPAAPFINLIKKTPMDQFENLKLSAQLMLDSPKRNIISAELIFKYGEMSHSGFTEKISSEAFDIYNEIRIENMVRKYFSKVSSGDTKAYISDNDDAVYELLTNGLQALSEECEIFASDSFNALKLRNNISLSIGVRMESDLLKLDIDAGDETLDELAAILRSYKKGKKYHRLKDGSFAALRQSVLEDFSELTDKLEISDEQLKSGNISIPRYRMLYLDKLIDTNTDIFFNRNSVFKKAVSDFSRFSSADYEIPDVLKGIMRPYQCQGYRWLKMISGYGFGGILADDMGLGKTLQTIALMLSLKSESGEHGKSLVVCPSTLAYNWESEIKKFAPSLRVGVISGTPVSRHSMIENISEIDVVITSYASLARDIHKYQDIEFYYEFADEAQYIKNHNTLNAKAVKAVKSRVRFALTGTPVENTIAELWSIFDFIMPGYFHSYGYFKKTYEIPVVKDKNEKVSEDLKKLASPFILRRIKKDVLVELPEKTETIMYSVMEGKQKKLYNANIAAARKEIAQSYKMQENDKNKFRILAILTRLRQICCDPSLVYENYDGESVKLQQCMQLVEGCTESGHKILLFSQFTSMLSRIEEQFIQSGITYKKLTGSLKSEERIRLVNEFNNDDTQVFLISLKAGGTGINLTSADIVIHFDPWWNLSAQNQATDRAYRIGQTNNVQVYKLLVRDTIEEKILNLQNAKAELASQIVRDGETGILNMSSEDMKALLS